MSSYADNKLTDTVEMLEREVKLCLTGSADYLRFAAALPVPRRWGMQLNVYLDTPDGRLRSRRVSLRVRITPDHARLTMKTPPGERTVGDIAAAAFVNMETEAAMDRERALAWVAQPAGATPEHIPGFEVVGTLTGCQPLVVTTWSLTRRAVCDTAWGVTIELDETVFPDGFRDFEIEAEHEDAELALRVIELHAAMAGVGISGQILSKHARARAHRGDLPWVMPAGAPTAAQPPLFVEDAPEAAFGLDPVAWVDLSR